MKFVALFLFALLSASSAFSDELLAGAGRVYRWRVTRAAPVLVAREAQLAELARLPGMGNVQVLVQQHRDQLVFLHQVAPGAADKSWGVHVARLAGVPSTVIERARDLLLGFESAGAHPSVKPRSKKPTAEQPTLFE